MRSKEQKKKTVDLCYHKEPDGTPCADKVMWKLKSEGKQFKICDHHLAWGLRCSGLPAYVDAFVSDREEE